MRLAPRSDKSVLGEQIHASFKLQKREDLRDERRPAGFRIQCTKAEILHRLNARESQNVLNLLRRVPPMYRKEALDAVQAHVLNVHGIFTRRG